MNLALSTHWNASRHRSGETMLREILDLGLDRVELGYDLTRDLVPGIQEMLRDHAVTVVSVHNFCPIPMGAPYGHPELFLLASLDRREREAAIRYTGETIAFAAEVGAQCVVIHAGRVDMRHLTPKLVALHLSGAAYSPKYERIKLKLMMRRDRKIQRHLEYLDEAFLRLLPQLQATGVRLGIENLPSWEAVPNEAETLEICRRFDSPLIGYWHDVGHAQIRETLGFIAQRHWLERLFPDTIGWHVHDVADVATDHLVPGAGKIDFRSFKNFIRSDTIVVLEPAPGTPAEDVRTGINIIRQAWQ